MDKINDSTKKAAPSMIWSFGERICAQLVTLIVSIVLARILTPDDYAAVAIILIFITIANVFVSSGFGIALIQKKDADNYDFSSTLYFSLSLSIVFYVGLFFLAPLISSLYEIPSLTPLIRVLGIRLIFASVNTIQHAYISKRMQFKKFFFSTLIGTIISSIIGIALALSGFGAWAIVAQYLSNTIIDTIVLTFVSGWRPKLYFSFKRIKKIFPFGSSILLTDLIGTLYNQSRGLIISRFYNKTDLSYYNQAEKYTSIFVTNIESSVNKVMVQVQSDSQDDLTILKNNTRKTIRLVMMILFPIQVGIALTSFSWVPLLLTDKWSGCIPYVMITAAFYLFFPLIETHARNLKALGKGKTILVLNIIRHTIGISAMVATIFLTDNAVILALVGIPTQFIAYLVFASFGGKTIKYTFKEQLFDLLPILGAVAIMGGVVFAEHFLPFGNLLVLLIQVFSGVVIYFAMCYLLAKSDVMSIVHLVDRYIDAFKNRKKKHYKISPLYILTGVFVISLGGASLYAKYKINRDNNLIDIAFRGVDSDDLVISRSGRGGYVMKGKSEKTQIFSVGTATLKPGKYVFSGLYKNSESNGVCGLQLVDIKENNKLLCQFGTSTSPSYASTTIQTENECYVRVRLIVYEGWNGNTKIVPSLKEAEKDTECSYYYGNEYLKKPMMTIIDDDGDKKFMDKWIPVIEKYQIPITTAVVSNWVDSLDYCMDWNDLSNVKKAGGEVVCHTENHDMDYYRNADVDEIIESYSRAKAKMKEHDLDTDAIIYCGDTGDSENVRIAGSKVFKIGVHSGGDSINVKSSYDKFNIRRFNLITEKSSLSYYKQIIDQCIQENGWLVWMSHSQYDELDDELMDAITGAIEYCKERNVDIVTVKEANERISY